MNLHFLSSRKTSLRRRLYIFGGVVGSLALAISPGLVQAAAQEMAVAKQDIIIHGPILWPYPGRPSEDVRVQFVAEGNEWGAVYLDDRLLYRPHNFNRRQEVRIEKGAYHLRITGVDFTEIWASGYLDVGRNDSHALIVVFSKDNGVQVVGDPYAWLPDVTNTSR